MTIDSDQPGQSPEQTDFNDWDMTDPRKHNPKNFRYIVYTVTDPERQKDRSQRYQEAGLDINEIPNPLTDPNGFIERDFISCSLIDHDHRATMGFAGVILKVPRRNIIEASPHDIGFTDDRYMLFYPPENIPSAEDILRQTDTTDGKYNEVIVKGEIDDEFKINISGVFIVTDSTLGLPIDVKLSEKLKDFALKRQIPIINIEKP